MTTEPNYAKAVHDLLADSERAASASVTVEGRSIQLKRPDEFKLFRLLELKAENRIDDIDFSVGLVRLAIPGIDQSQALRLLVLDGYPKEGAILKAIVDNWMGEGSVFEQIEANTDGLRDANEAAKSPEAAPDFSKASD